MRLAAEAAAAARLLREEVALRRSGPYFLNRRRAEAQQRAFARHDPTTTYDPMALHLGARLLEARRPALQNNFARSTKPKLQARGW